MTDDQFWGLIEAAKAEAGGDGEAQIEALRRSLMSLPPEEIIEFDVHYDRRRSEAYRWSLWGAALVLNGLCSDDGFEYFRGWLIAQGKELFEAALKDPDGALAPFAGSDQDLELEGMLYVAGEAYEEKTGLAYPQPEYKPLGMPAGERWDEDHFEELYPQIEARYSELSGAE